MDNIAIHRLISAAQRFLRTSRRKSIPADACLRIAGEFLAVGSGLKPGFLYDYNAAGAVDVLNYCLALRQLGLTSGMASLYVFELGGSVLLLNLEHSIQRLEMLIGRKDANFPAVDVSANRALPAVCSPAVRDQIRCHLSDILQQLKVLRHSSGDMVHKLLSPPEWNLCTLFGTLLGYPLPYWFDTSKGFENCLALTPLRVYTVKACCSRVAGGINLTVYSFSVPECVLGEVEDCLDTWLEELQNGFRGQSDFSDLTFSTKTVSLAAVAL
ncbi:UPF0739 protein C1orf74 homolog [Protopterus annectens]|uniref:UPF0739 protein C1orf74 homolog n=1 Tax=Protopterus annectens TaxID=7888 RepID=UPI001CFA8DE5|nr:UPF0739 protein C1orf74 homolog [Protopterus annectens]